MRKKYWVEDVSGTVPALLKWWDGVAAILDVTNPHARYAIHVGSILHQFLRRVFMSSIYSGHYEARLVSYFVKLLPSLCREEVAHTY